MFIIESLTDASQEPNLLNKQEADWFFIVLIGRKIVGFLRDVTLSDGLEKLLF